jgi:hypothetical protein
VAEEGDGQPGEVDGAALHVEDHLDAVGIEQVVDVFHADAGGGHVDAFVGQQGGHRVRDRLRGDERFVALHVDHHAGRVAGRHFRDAVGAGPVGGRGHDRQAAEGVDSLADALVIGGHDDVFHQGTGAHPLPDMLQDRLAFQREKHLARQPAGIVTGGDDGETSLHRNLPGSGLNRPIGSAGVGPILLYLK